MYFATENGIPSPIFPYQHGFSLSQDLGGVTAQDTRACLVCILLLRTQGMREDATCSRLRQSMGQGEVELKSGRKRFRRGKESRRKRSRGKKSIDGITAVVQESTSQVGVGVAS